jgi:orotate phosphoribosyltransferase
MQDFELTKAELLCFLRAKSVFRGEFKLSSGAQSNYYVDCKLVTLDPKGAWLVGKVMHHIIREEETSRGIRLHGVGGLTMGADPIAMAIGMISFWTNDDVPFQVFSVRKSPKAHGQTKLIEGNFKTEDLVVVIDDVVTRGESTLAAINAVEKEGGKVAFVVVLVDRQEGGRKIIEDRGYSVISVFDRDTLLSQTLQSPRSTPCLLT